MTISFSISPWIPHTIFIAMTVLLVGMLLIFRLTGRGRRSPLTSDLLRAPGESLRSQIDYIGESLNVYIWASFTVPIMALAVYSLSHVSKEKVLGTSLSLGLMVAAFLAFSLVRIWLLLKKRRHLYLALDCEMAVGQELNQLMLEGCQVYHDFQADRFNIDHIVLGPKGVFAVETKGRAKRNKKGGTAEAAVEYDGEKLNFPSWSEKKPIQQARLQAKWLQNWLSKAVGEPLTVQPVLALPGWFITLKKLSDVFIFNGKPAKTLLARWDSTLSDTMIKRIAHQLEQRCRDVEPLAYSKKQ